MRILFNKICFFAKEKQRIQDAMDKVLKSGNYIKGFHYNILKEHLSYYTGWKYISLVGNCTDAIEIALKAMKDIDNYEDKPIVVSQANAGKPTLSAITNAECKLELLDVEKTGLIDYSKSEDYYDFLIPVDLYGQIDDGDSILPIIRDCAQSFGRPKDSSLAHCYSFYPTKPLGALGDGGAIGTDWERFHYKCEDIANYGTETIGRNSRLDEIQAAILLARLPYVEDHRKLREEIGLQYEKKLRPLEFSHRYIHSDDTWHIYHILVENREESIKSLNEAGIEIKIHYEWSKFSESLPYLKNTLIYNKHVLSLPIYSDLLKEDVNYIIENVKKYCKPFTTW